MLAAQAMQVEDRENILDMCSAPGGKAVYISELADVNVTACDIHPLCLDKPKRRTSLYAQSLEFIFRQRDIFCVKTL